MKNTELAKYIITKFVEEPINWPKEIKLSKVLLKNWVREDFWQLKEAKKFPTLACLLTDRAKSFLTQQYTKFEIENPVQKVYNLSETPVGEDIKTETKPRSLMEFIK